MMKKIVIVYNTSHYIVLFRLNLIKALQEKGYKVFALAPLDKYSEILKEIGVEHLPINMSNGTNPFLDLLLFWRYYQAFRREAFDVLLAYTVKPNIYGSLAAHALGIPVINNIAGLGAVFIKGGWLTRLVRGLYRLSLGHSTKVFFQNDDDQRLFIEGRLVRPEVADRVPGSGVDLVRFPFFPSPPRRGRGGQNGQIRFLLIARMLWDKGVGEYVEAARSVKHRFPNAEFCLLGFLDVQNPAAISRVQMDEWVAGGEVQYLGETDDVRPHLTDTDCVVLPSYREGTPRTLLEAAAMGRPIITTDAVGCREVVDHGVSGFLCRPRDAADLTEKIERMIALSPEERAEMGRRGREKVERDFDEQIVINRYLEVIKQIAGGSM